MAAARTGGALAILGPARAVVVRVLALGRADTARHRAVHVHEPRVVLALPLLGPVVAVGRQVGALGRAEAARGGALGVHVRGRALALAQLRPRGARLFAIRAHDRAHAAAVRADFLRRPVEHGRPNFSAHALFAFLRMETYQEISREIF